MLTPVPVVTQHLPEATEAVTSIFRISPRAAKLARDCVIDPRRIQGSGPAGRIIERDVTEVPAQYDGSVVGEGALLLVVEPEEDGAPQ